MATFNARYSIDIICYYNKILYMVNKTMSMPIREAAQDSSSLAEQAYTAIRQQIVNGELVPGQRISIRPIAKMLGMSPMPVAEAFRLLVRDGLIQSEPRFGSRVSVLDREALRQQHMVRIAIECESARQCAIHASDRQLHALLTESQALDQAAKRCRSAKQVTSLEEMADLDSRFHLRIANFSGVGQFVELLTANQLIRRLTKTGSYLATELHSHGEGSHELIAKAIATRDSQQADQAMRDHCTGSMELQLEIFIDNQDLGI